MKKIFTLFIILFVFGALNVIAEEGSDNGDSGNSNSGSSDTSNSMDNSKTSDNSGSSKKEEVRTERRERIKDGELEIREKSRQKTADGETREETRREIKGDKEKLRSLLEEKLKDTPAHEKNRILKITEKVNDVESFINNLSPEEAKKFALLTRAKQVEIAKERKSSELKEIKIMEVKDEEFKIREITKERIENSIEKFKEAREKRIELREGIKETRNELKEAKTDGEKLVVAKKHLTKIIDSELTELEALKGRIENNQDVNPEESADSLSRIDNAISGLNELKAKIGSAATLDELRAIGPEIKKHALVRHIYKTRAAAANICHGVLLRSELMERKAELALARAEENGADTTELNLKIEGLSDLLENARTKCKEAKTTFDSAKETDDPEAKKELVKRSINSTKEAHRLVKEAHQVVVEIRKIVSGLNVSLDEQEVSEITVEEGENV